MRHLGSNPPLLKIWCFLCKIRYFSRARARARDNINIYRDICEFSYNETRTIGPLLVGLRKSYIHICKWVNFENWSGS